MFAKRLTARIQVIEPLMHRLSYASRVGRDTWRFDREIIRAQGQLHAWRMHLVAGYAQDRFSKDLEGGLCASRWQWSGCNRVIAKGRLQY